MGLAAFGGLVLLLGPLVSFRVWDCCGALKFNKVSDVWISGLRVSNACSGNEGSYIYIYIGCRSLREFVSRWTPGRHFEFWRIRLWVVRVQPPNRKRWA